MPCHAPPPPRHKLLCRGVVLFGPTTHGVHMPLNSHPRVRCDWRGSVSMHLGRHGKSANFDVTYFEVRRTLRGVGVGVGVCFGTCCILRGVGTGSNCGSSSCGGSCPHIDSWCTPRIQTWYQGRFGGHLDMENSIAFGSAPQREADSQPISQLVRQAIGQTVSQARRQADKSTHFGFFQRQTPLQVAGRATTIRTNNGNASDHRRVGQQFDSQPGPTAAAPADLSALPILTLIQTPLSTNF